MALKEFKLFDEPSLPFDSVRSSLEGVIDCINTDFANFFPQEIKRDERFPKYYAFVGKYIGFYHHNHNLHDVSVIDSFKRKIVRFDEKVKKGGICFLRTVCKEGELDLYLDLQKALDTKYPGISYIICFIIPYQIANTYYKNLDNRTFIFTLHNSYGPIFDMIKNNDLFNNIPVPDLTVELKGMPSDLWMVDGYPMVGLPV